MKRIYTTETFELPTWRKVGLMITLVLCVGGCVLTIWQLQEDPVFLIATLVFLLVSVSMYFYMHAKLEISDEGIVFFNGMKSLHIDWNTISSVDLKLVGKYSDPQIFIHYNNTKLSLAASFYGKKQLKGILDLLEMKVAPDLFTPAYQQLRTERLQSA
ncbi:MAG: hypothetical protein JO154_13410 [Chitinophaga sp.]|uniref:hypothetical protein n=1 Tax=Chitinophaga sp. TaxID=1869181 RepID=UPI0025BE667F|nr:hypothetical protein [Chitinophaga sp.]MBV8253599.1 hypothetical protein [Chitinophaga sp.]